MSGLAVPIIGPVGQERTRHPPSVRYGDGGDRNLPYRSVRHNSVVDGRLDSHDFSFHRTDALAIRCIADQRKSGAAESDVVLSTPRQSVDAGLPLVGLAAVWTHLAIYVIPLGEHAHGPGVPLGWPPRFLFLAHTVWLMTVACQALAVHKRRLVAVSGH